jgi:hypothetical protein
LWLSLYDVEDDKFQFAARAKERLAPLELEDPPRLLVVNDDVTVPLTLPTGVERGEVMTAILGQIREIIRLLRTPEE